MFLDFTPLKFLLAGPPFFDHRDRSPRDSDGTLTCRSVGPRPDGGAGRGRGPGPGLGACGGDSEARPPARPGPGPAPPPPLSATCSGEAAAGPSGSQPEREREPLAPGLQSLRPLPVSRSLWAFRRLTPPQVACRLLPGAGGAGKRISVGLQSCNNRDFKLPLPGAWAPKHPGQTRTQR